jgi:hypothetical protein
MLKLRNVFIVALMLVLATGFVAAQTQKRVLQQDNAPRTQEAPLPTGTAAILDQAPNQSNGIFSDAGCDFCGGPQVLAENFNVVGGAGEISQITIWGGYFPGNNPPPVDAFTIIIHDNQGGLPGPVAAGPDNQACTKTDTGVNLFGVDEWKVDCTVAFTIPDGSYWLEMFNNTSNNSSFFWEVGNLDAVGGGPGSAFAFEAPGAAWNLDAASNLATQILADAPVVPAVSGLGLALLTLVLGGGSGYIVSRRRRQ